MEEIDPKTLLHLTDSWTMLVDSLLKLFPDYCNCVDDHLSTGPLVPKVL